MKLTQICIKITAVLLVVALSTVAYGMEILSSFEENAPFNESITGRDALPYENANAKNPRVSLGNCKNLAKQGKTREMPFLVKGIKYKRILENETIVYTNSNQKMVYSIPRSMCVYYRYECPVGKEKLSSEECEAEARKCVYSVFSGFVNMKITDVELSEDSDGICSFLVKTAPTEDDMIKISVRKDTGSIVLYDARDCTVTG